MNYDIFNATCPKCENTSDSDGFRVQVDADAIIGGGELIDMRLFDVHYWGDMTCRKCGYSGTVEEFCEGEVSD